MDKIKAFIANIDLAPVIEGLTTLATELGGEILALLWIVVPFISMIYIGKIGFNFALQFWIEAKANEWMLVIRNGKMIKKGVGMATFRLPGD